ncbi:hypothetical protein PFISCL1PPCAC_9776, partial [Pristionchus fissidentatus]
AIYAFSVRGGNTMANPTGTMDCASTGCMLSSTALCFINSNRTYECSCQSLMSGGFCEKSDVTSPSTCGSEFKTELIDVEQDHFLHTDCGCKSDMSSCVANRGDPCGGKCSDYGSCLLIPTSPTATEFNAACVCNPGYGGEFCDRSSPKDCSFSPCYNNGICITLTDPTGYKCQCMTGFTGTWCEYLLDACPSNFCMNGGTCITISSNTPMCECVAGFSGRQCELQLYPTGCFNGGQLVSDGSCLCPLPWDGVSCTVLKDPMPPDVCGCKNNGVCVYDTKGGVATTSCRCEVGTVGAKCEESFSYCALAPCSSHGTCADYHNYYTCQC